MSSIFTDLNTALGSTLNNSSALTTALGGTFIYYLQAPQAQAFPFVVWSYVTEMPENISPSELHQAVIYVRCYGTSAAQGGTIDGIIDGLIDGKTLTLANSWVNYWSKREESIPLVDSDPGETPVCSIGAYYRINLDK